MAFIARDFHSLQRQIRNFNIEDAECHCCSVGHCDPETGALLHCDRQLVHAMLKEWFPCKDIAFTDSTTTTTTLHLQKFDDLVRRQVCLARAARASPKSCRNPLRGVNTGEPGLHRGHRPLSAEGGGMHCQEHPEPCAPLNKHHRAGWQCLNLRFVESGGKEFFALSSAADSPTRWASRSARRSCGTSCAALTFCRTSPAGKRWSTWLTICSRWVLVQVTRPQRGQFCLRFPRERQQFYGDGPKSM